MPIQLLLQDVVHETDPIRSGDKTKSLSPGNNRSKAACWPKENKEGHESVPPVLALLLGRCGAEFIFPHVPRRLTVEGTHKRRFRPSRHGDQSFQHGLSRDGVLCPHSVDRHDRGLRVNLGEHLKNVTHTFCPSSRGHGVLVRCNRCRHCLAELLGHRSCHQPAPDDNPSHPTLAQQCGVVASCAFDASSALCVLTRSNSDHLPSEKSWKRWANLPLWTWRCRNSPHHVNRHRWVRCPFLQLHVSFCHQTCPC